MTETQAMTYDAYGRETGTSSSEYSASTAKSYNDRGQLATESTTYSGRTYTVTYHYDAQGRPNKLTYPSGREAEYTYDDRQLLKTIKWETAQIEDRSYNDAGMLTGVDRAFVDETRTYNAGSQLTQINNTNVGSQTYTYDLNGNVTSETLSGNMANYSFSTIHAGGPFADGYDAEDRLMVLLIFPDKFAILPPAVNDFGNYTAVPHQSKRLTRSATENQRTHMRFKRSGVTEDILLTRSNIGNISNVNRNGTNTARGYNTAHGLTTVSGGTTQTYDTDGNTTKLHTNVTAAWDDAGRMRNTNVPAGATAGIVGLNENGYVAGTRIWKKITRSGSVVEHRVHIHAGPNLIAEYNAGVAASTPVQEYVYAGEIDSLVAIRRSDATKYGVTRNRQWSITALHDMANGNVVERYAYEMTGKRTIYAANGTTVRTTSTYGNPFGYTNRSHDEDSGLMYFRARHYNPLTGEFLSRDPLEFVDGMSLYQGYFILNRVDATGLTTTWRYHVNWIRLIDGRSASYHVNLSIFLPDAADRPEPGVNPQKIKKLQLWQINTRKGFYVKQKDGACERVSVDVRTIDIGNLDETYVQKDENGKEYVIDDSLWIMNDDEICFAFIQVKKKVGFNSATDVLKNGMFDNPTDSFWNHVKDKIRPPFATYYSDYFFIKPECKCCFPEWLHWIFLTDKGFEAIDANGTIKRSAI